MSDNYKKAISDLIARLTWCLGIYAFLRTAESMLHTASQTGLYKLVNCI